MKANAQLKSLITATREMPEDRLIWLFRGTNSFGVALICE